MMGVEITDELKEVIRKRMDDNTISRRQLARELNISSATVSRYAHKLGGKNNNRIKKDRTEEIVLKYYPNYSAREIAEMKPEGVSLSRSSILRWVQRLGVKHNEETEQRLIQKKAKNITHAFSQETIKRRAQTWKRKRRVDELRVESGMPQKTKHVFRTVPLRYLKAAYQLEYKYNYIRTTNAYIIWYDDSTHRVSTESLYIQKYGFRFEKAQD